VDSAIEWLQKAVLYPRTGLSADYDFAAAEACHATLRDLKRVSF
jgi:hypothetical protein